MTDDITMKNRGFYLVVILLVGVSLIAGSFAGYSMPKKQNLNQGAYDLTLVITNSSSSNTSMNSMYAFFEENGSHLQSSSVIRVPMGALVRITIVNYDHGTSKLMVSNDSSVSGVNGNLIQVYTGVNVTQEQISAGTGSVTYSTVNAKDISHTFTTSTGLNIPVLPFSTSVGYTYFNTAGTISWGCMCFCGELPMDSPGWMMGSIVVYTN